MKRIDAIRIWMEALRAEDLALFTTGMISREAFSVRDRDRNFYVLGSMGLVSSLGLGIAMNTDKKVFIFDGDGSLLMNLGIMPMTAHVKPANLVHLVFDNGSYQSTGGQPTISGSVDIKKIAEDFGYRRSVRFTDEEPMAREAKTLSGEKGPLFIHIQVDQGSGPSVTRITVEPVLMARRFAKAVLTA